MYILGITVVIFGLAFLLRNLGLLEFTASFWSVFYPVLIIFIGLVIVTITHEGRRLLRKIKEFLHWVDKAE